MVLIVEDRPLAEMLQEFCDHPTVGGDGLKVLSEDLKKTKLILFFLRIIDC